MRPYDSGYNVTPSSVAFRGFKPFIVSARFHLHCALFSKSDNAPTSISKTTTTATRILPVF